MRLVGGGGGRLAVAVGWQQLGVALHGGVLRASGLSCCCHITACTLTTLGTLTTALLTACCHLLTTAAAKLNPITLVGDGTAVQHVFIKSPPPGKGPPQAQHPQATPAQQQQQPTVETAVVGSIAATDFNSVAGLGAVCALSLRLLHWSSGGLGLGGCAQHCTAAVLSTR